MKHRPGRYLVVFAFLLTQTHILIQVSASQTDQAALTVGGEVEKPLKLSAAEIAKLPRTTVRAKDHSGTESTFEGVALVEFLKLAGVPLGEKLRGKAVSNFVVVDGVDGYRAVFAIPELDPAFTDRVILLADKRDGKPLSEAEGPLRVVVSQEKRQARWVRQVTRLTICQPACR
jgi:DMSO/TMAO reductase YedYZ molybdopterin-dependent catalytic subunit